jgi:TetR/AcrR family transcriptional regulator, regulator of cefoperazone and chloramphenicol sensitivity
LSAALECISATSISELSVRAIAAKAEVNVATVHYYFGTKDSVVTEALERFLDEPVEFLESSLGSLDDPRAKLSRFLASYMSFFQANPGIFASMIEAISASSIRRGPRAPSSAELVLIGMISGLKGRLMSLVAEVSGIRDEETLILKTIQLMTSLLHPILASTLPKSLFDVDFADEAARSRYIELVIASLEGSPKGGAI